MKRIVGWSLLVAAVLAVILVPFALWGPGIEAWARTFTEPSTNRTAAALALGGLLAADILLPVPSSLVSTVLGYLLGFAGGMLVSLAGMTVSSLAGYGIGRFGGRPAAGRLVGAADLKRLGRLNSAWGDWFIVVTRPVPVLAEAAVFFAGIGRMAFPRFVVLCSLSNLGVSAVYAAIGSFANGANSFLLAFAGAIILPGLAMALWRRRRNALPPGQEH